MLDRIVENLGYSLQLRMDSDPEIISLAIAQWAEDFSVALQFISPGKPRQIAFIDCFNRIYRREMLDFYLFRMLNEASEIIDRLLNVYKGNSPHESLNNLTPNDYILVAESIKISKSVWH